MPFDEPEIPDAGARATRREWIGLAVLALPCMLYSMDLTVLNLAVPELSADLAPSAAQLLWIVDIYGFMLAGMLVTMGTLGDRIGRRRLLLWGATAFGIASVFAAFANSAPMLIVARALLGVAGATLAPSTLSLVRSMFVDRRQRTFAIAVWITSFSVGGALGPLIGGALLEYFWWGSVFLVSVPVMLLLLAVGPLLLPEFRDPDAGRLDPASAALSLAAVLATIFGLKRIAHAGLDAAAVLALLAGGLVGWAFVRRQRRLAHPLIDLSLFRLPAFSAPLATNMLGIFTMFGSFFFIAQYLQLVLGLTPLRAGLWMLPSSLAFIAASLLSPLVTRRARPGHVMAGGLAVSALGFTVIAGMSASYGLPAIVAGAILISLGASPVVTLATDLVVGAAPAERAGAASAISETSFELGGALGIAVLGSIASAVYRRDMGDAVPRELPAAAAEVAAETLGGAVMVAAQLSGDAGRTLLLAARDAFVQSFELTAAISAFIGMIAAGMAAVLLRRVARA